MRCGKDGYGEEVLRGFEPRSLESESRVLTVTPQDQVNDVLFKFIFLCLCLCGVLICLYFGISSFRVRRSRNIENQSGRQKLFRATELTGQNSANFIDCTCTGSLLQWFLLHTCHKTELHSILDDVDFCTDKEFAGVGSQLDEIYQRSLLKRSPALSTSSR